MTRYERLHRPALVKLAHTIRDMAVAEAKKSGKPILYLTQWDIGKLLGTGTQNVALALRLSYTAEFRDQYGWGFVAPGNGRGGDRVGYVLSDDVVAPDEGLENVHDAGHKLLDHLREEAGYFTDTRAARAKAGQRKQAKVAGQIASMLDGAATSIEVALTK